MVQLSLLAEDVHTTLSEHLARLHASASRRGVDPACLRQARDATALRFRDWEGTALDSQGLSRVGAYYNAVIRRRVLEGRTAGALEARRRLVARSIEADLLSAGWDPERVTAEVRRVMGSTSTDVGVA
jgi:hypothetical protein